MSSYSPIAKVIFDTKEVPLNIAFEFPQLGHTISIEHDRAGAKRVENARFAVARYLHTMLNAILEYPPPFSQTETALRLLRHGAEELMFALVDDDYDKAYELQAAFASAWPTFREFGDEVPVVEVDAHGDDPFLEILQLFDPREIPPIKDYVTLEKTAGQFLGFSAVVQRLTPSGEAVTMRADPTLPVQFLRHRIDSGPRKLFEKLPFLYRMRKESGTEGEAALFRSLSAMLDLQGPWPDRELDGDEAKARVLDLLFDSTTGLDGVALQNPIQIHHFACHCDTAVEFDEDYEISLSTPNGVEIALKLSEFRSGYKARTDIYRQREARPIEPRSLVVFNACGSSQPNYRSSASFPRFFLRTHHRGFVGTEAYVPDDAARDYCERLYCFLLTGMPIGKAIVQARRKLLLDFRDPTGIVYSFYGNPELRIEGVQRPCPTGWN